VLTKDFRIGSNSGGCSNLVTVTAAGPGFMAPTAFTWGDEGGASSNRLILSDGAMILSKDAYFGNNNNANGNSALVIGSGRCGPTCTICTWARAETPPRWSSAMAPR